jgi:hypothetical protein
LHTSPASGLRSPDVAILVGASIAIDVARSPEGEKAVRLLRMKVNEVLDEEISKIGRKDSK